ncbi:hypothetical protein NNJEOMEG_01753 [Fundidesulfovibrio magnetotacticus]|uniref:N-acyl amino acid synthase FeeM catalytic core domain-containing protein n=1 Tax=Fundidesulfovibrio magnetotacticus TaxID=2730080 RepID=A0A6V8M0B5_9BACT|nr:hypothetical protein [Fundidesulfovibrio magnetotacticus]GFK93915.1 hypothetical protein NNJEOMEG_01753 [Fundidesulfovibrio magnetotacticus]
MQHISLSNSSGSPLPPPIAQDDGSTSGADRRRTIRIRRSALLDAKLESLDRPSIKIAETMEEYSQAFGVLHDVYVASGYLRSPLTSGMHFGIHHLLPKTCVFVFKTYLTVISTMSYIPDTPQFGLPMDELYKDELDSLRAQGRKIIEVGSLATSPHRRWQNIVVFLAKAIFTYALSTGADDLCIMVNPKHVRFYKSIFLFEEFGEAKHYGKVDAPAVALRADMRDIESALFKAYHDNDFDTNLHAFFVKVNARPGGHEVDGESSEKDYSLDNDIMRHLLHSNPFVLHALSPGQLAWLKQTYGCVISQTPPPVS